MDGASHLRSGALAPGGCVFSSSDPFEVVADGGDSLPIAGSKESTVLALLLARWRRVVSVDDLIEELWGEHPPRTAEKTVGSHVSRLRRALRLGQSPGSNHEVIVSRGLATRSNPADT
jgi:DNA-binding SARP family transcriptional activator